MTPQEPLKPPAISPHEGQDWTVLARNRRVNKSWNELVRRAPEESLRCYLHLLTQPMTRIPFRCFPLRGHLYRGVWEFEVTSGDRVFYVPDAEHRTVDVYYADAHPKPPAPRP